MSTIAIIQARLGSSRLPGKVLMDIGGKSVLEHVFERTSAARALDRVVVTMPNSERDDELANFCEKKGIPFVRGPEEDLLGQYYSAAKFFHAEHIIRITADCPFIDPEVIDHVISGYKIGNCDYVSTGRLETTYPDGLDTEIFSFTALEKAFTEATLPSEREHVTPYIWKHPELFKVQTVQFDHDLSDLRLTVDEPRDLEFIREIYKGIGSHKLFLLQDILHFLDEHPDVVKMNEGIVRNSGYFKSLRDDPPLDL